MWWSIKPKAYSVSRHPIENERKFWQKQCLIWRQIINFATSHGNLQVSAGRHGHKAALRVSHVTGDLTAPHCTVTAWWGQEPPWCCLSGHWYFHSTQWIVFHFVAYIIAHSKRHSCICPTFSKRNCLTYAPLGYSQTLPALWRRGVSVSLGICQTTGSITAFDSSGHD